MMASVAWAFSQRNERARLAAQALVVAGMWLLVHTTARAELAPSIPEGKLLLEASLSDVLELGIYGPENATAGEPSLLTVYVVGNESTRISSGIVMLAVDRDAVQFRRSPPASARYIPCRQWSADTASEWKQLLVIGPQTRWAYNMLPMAHIGYQAGPGELLDSILAVPGRPVPPPDSPFRDRSQYARTGVAFITDENIKDNTTMTPTLSAQEQCQGAHGVRADFPAVIKDPASALHVWVVLNANGKYVSKALSVNFSERKVQATNYTEVTGPPEVTSPQDGAKVSGTVDVIGKTKPGLLVAAWIEIYAPEDPDLRTKLPPVRHIAGDYGDFQIPMTLPFADAGDETALVYELHVRTEAPAYQSPETVLKLDLAAEQ